MSRHALTTLQPLVIGFLAMLPSTAAADDTLAEAQKLYAAAYYERALTTLEQISPQQTVELRDQQSIRRYKALCLIALDRGAEAARVVNDLVLAEPMTSGDPADPPRLRDLIREARLRVVPGIVRDRYSSGRAHFLQKAFTAAASDFESVVALIDDKDLELAQRPEFVDLRLIAQGFLELSRNGASDAAAASQPAAAESAPASEEKGSVPVDVIPPVVISQELPPVPYALRQVLRQPREGAIEVTVSVDGSVEAATVVTPSHPVYDALLVAAARNWKYRPATRGGAPVAYKKRIRAVFPN